VELFFSAPMDRDEVHANLKAEPRLDDPLSLRWTDDDTRVEMYGPMQPSTQYTLSLPAGTRDRFGRAMVDAFSLSFKAPAGAASPNAAPVMPNAWLISPGPVGTYNAYEHPRALVRTTNVTRLAYTVDALDEAAVVKFHAAPQKSDQIPDGRRVLSGATDLEPENNVPKLSEIDLGGLAPGYYRLRIEAREPSARVPDHLLVVSRTMLAVKESASQVLVWATDLRTGGSAGEHTSALRAARCGGRARDRHYGFLGLTPGRSRGREVAHASHRRSRRRCHAGIGYLERRPGSVDLRAAVHVCIAAGGGARVLRPANLSSGSDRPPEGHRPRR
jgi:hypothetical protein